MKTSVILLFAFILPSLINGQSIEVHGNLKVNVMDTFNTVNDIVVKLPDGTLATRLLSSLPPSTNTARTWQTDLLLTSTLCNCSTLRAPIVQSLLDNGYTVQDLLNFGLCILQLYNAEVSVQVLRDGDLSIHQLYTGGISVRNLIDGGVTIPELMNIGITVQQFLTADEPPINLYNNGTLLDSLIGKIYVGGMIFHMDTNTGDGLVASTQNFGDPSWGCFDTFVGAIGKAIGAGQLNTEAMINAECPDLTLEPYILDPIINGQYGNWFIPSKDELNEMYVKIGPGAPPPYTNIGNFFTTKYYWTSTEENASFAWRQSFIDGTQSIYNKGIVGNYPFSKLIKSF
ncbi:hypothetical protein [Portibacter marinus]|uniref:hypothetical protein n=1 Tax=Portibacter marinus TaxID=2898660 RepID=UPI001F17D67D|nr:hypothetical protein [Portibacter marinus]